MKRRRMMILTVAIIACIVALWLLNRDNADERQEAEKESAQVKDAAALTVGQVVRICQEGGRLADLLRAEGVSCPAAKGAEEVIESDGDDPDVGLPGIDGMDGVNGSDGADGTDGTRGPRGFTGADGEDGIDGQDGDDSTTPGESGTDGTPGPAGPPGPPGDPGPPGPAGERGPEGAQGPAGPPCEDGFSRQTVTVLTNSGPREQSGCYRTAP